MTGALRVSTAIAALIFAAVLLALGAIVTMENQPRSYSAHGARPAAVQRAGASIVCVPAIPPRVRVTKGTIA